MEVDDGVIRTSDGQGTSRELPVAELSSVVVATDDSGPWGDDVVFLLYSEEICFVTCFLHFQEVIIEKCMSDHQNEDDLIESGSVL